jgi:hypothetical protein
MIGLWFKKVWATINCCFLVFSGFIYMSNRNLWIYPFYWVCISPSVLFFFCYLTALGNCILWNNTFPSFLSRKQTFLSNVELTAPQLISKFSYNSFLNCHFRSSSGLLFPNDILFILNTPYTKVNGILSIFHTRKHLQSFTTAFVFWQFVLLISLVLCRSSAMDAN